jgi:hypothetical protein
MFVKTTNDDVLSPKKTFWLRLFLENRCKKRKNSILFEVFPEFKITILVSKPL